MSARENVSVETDVCGSMSLPDELPSNYEECGECGYDHSYEPEESFRAHLYEENEECR